MAYLKVLSWYMAGNTKGNHENLRFKPGTLQIHVYSNTVHTNLPSGTSLICIIQS
jgi:hypothetical protein